MRAARSWNPVVDADHQQSGHVEAERSHQQVQLAGRAFGKAQRCLERRRLERRDHRAVGFLLRDADFAERPVDERRVAAFLGEIFFDRRAERFVGHRVQRALIAERGQFLGERVRGEQPDKTLDVVRIDAAEPYVFGLDRARGKLTPERHRGPFSVLLSARVSRHSSRTANHTANHSAQIMPRTDSAAAMPAFLRARAKSRWRCRS